LLVLMLLASAGFIPATQTVRKSVGGRPFPCQIHACGCSNSAACGEHCCCFSPVELADWYRDHAAELAAYDAQHGPPSESQQAYERRIAVVSNERTTPASPSATSTDAARRPRACCAAHASPRVAEPACEQAPSDEETFEIVQISLAAQRRCQGVSEFWLALSQALPVDSTPLWQFDEAVAAFSDSYDATCPCVVSRPAVPPPRA